jgi:hypothetical protein
MFLKQLVSAVAMSHYYKLQQHPRTGRNFIKKGRLHSQKALLDRQWEWLKKWSRLLQVPSAALDEIGNSNDDTVSLSEHSYR